MTRTRDLLCQHLGHNMRRQLTAATWSVKGSNGPPVSPPRRSSYVSHATPATLTASVAAVTLAALPGLLSLPPPFELPCPAPALARLCHGALQCRRDLDRAPAGGGAAPRRCAAAGTVRSPCASPMARSQEPARGSSALAASTLRIKFCKCLVRQEGFAV
jgi:hypothetical protein